MRHKELRHFVCLILAVPVYPQQTPQKEQFVTVVSPETLWTRNNVRLKQRDVFPAGDQIRTDKPDKLILGCPARQTVSYSCRLAPCTVQACQTERAAGLEIESVTVGAGIHWPDFLFRETKAPVFALARAGGNPADAVLRLKAGSVDFGPALQRVLEGEYCLRLRDLPLDVSRPPRVVNINWDRATNADGPAAVTDVRPGLYQLEVGIRRPGGCNVDPEQIPAWVLVAPEDDYLKLSTEWRAALRQLTDLDRAGETLALIATLRHAYLASLAGNRQ
jgi:hypothetical protein